MLTPTVQMMKIRDTAAKYLFMFIQMVLLCHRGHKWRQDLNPALSNYWALAVDHNTGLYRLIFGFSNELVLFIDWADTGLGPGDTERQ